MLNRPVFTTSLSAPLQSGLGLLDVLIALLLLSLSLLSAGAASLHALRAGHSATLQVRATDLAADLVEDLDSAPAAGDALVERWQARVATALPAAAGMVSSNAAHLHWRGIAETADLSLPIVPPAVPAIP